MSDNILQLTIRDRKRTSDSRIRRLKRKPELTPGTKKPSTLMMKLQGQDMSILKPSFL